MDCGVDRIVLGAAELTTEVEELGGGATTLLGDWLVWTEALVVWGKTTGELVAPLVVVGDAGAGVPAMVMTLVVSVVRALTATWTVGSPKPPASLQYPMLANCAAISASSAHLFPGQSGNSSGRSVSPFMAVK